MGKITEKNNSSKLFDTVVNSNKHTQSFGLSNHQLKRMLSKNRLTSKFGAENL